MIFEVACDARSVPVIKSVCRLFFIKKMITRRNYVIVLCTPCCASKGSKKCLYTITTNVWYNSFKMSPSQYESSPKKNAIFNVTHFKAKYCTTDLSYMILYIDTSDTYDIGKHVKELIKTNQ